MKISFEIILVLYRKYEIPYPKNKIIVKDFLNQNIQFIDDTIDIDEFLDHTIIFQKRPFFLQLLEKLDIFINSESY